MPHSTQTRVNLSNSLHPECCFKPCGNPIPIILLECDQTLAWPSMQVSRKPPATSTEPRASPFSNMSTSPVAAPTKARSNLAPAWYLHLS